MAQVAFTSVPEERGVRPGDPALLSTFIQYESEMHTAAYLGFGDLANFRAFMINEIILPFRITAARIKSLKKNYALQCLRDTREAAWDTEECPLKVYKVPEHASGAYRYGGAQAALLAKQLLRRMAHIRGVLPKQTYRDYDTDDKVYAKLTDPDHFKAVRKEFMDTLNRSLGAETAEDHIRIRPENLPHFGPLAGESELEPLNRCLVLFEHMIRIDWQSTFEGTEAWDRHQEVPDTLIPVWMRDPIQLDVHWNMKCPQKCSQDFMKKVGPEGLGILPEISQSIEVTIPRYAKAEDARDVVRTAFRLHEFSAQLQRLVFAWKNDEATAEFYDEHQVCIVHHPQRWEEILNLLVDKTKVVRCSVVLRIRGRREPCFEVDTERSRKRKR